MVADWSSKAMRRSAFSTPIHKRGAGQPGGKLPTAPDGTSFDSPWNYTAKIYSISTEMGMSASAQHAPNQKLEVVGNLNVTGRINWKAWSTAGI
jgi:hypothetical protein